MSLAGFDNVAPEIGRPLRLARCLWRARRHDQQRAGQLPRLPATHPSYLEQRLLADGTSDR
jgi:hypothetical protein